MNRKRFALLIGATILVLGGALGGFVLIHKSDKSAVKSAATTEAMVSEAVGMTVTRDTSLTQKTLSPADTQQGKLWGLSQPTNSSDVFSIDATYEQGASLKKLTAYSKQSLRDSVMGNINLQLPKQYPQYKELTQHNLTVNGTEANETIFEYMNNGVKIKQRLLLLFKNSDTAVYIRAQAKADQYEALNTQYFEPLFASARFE